VQLPFDHINTWVFDLDLTLYRPEANIMQQIKDRIELFVEDYFKVAPGEASVIRERYYRQYGTTLGGLMEEHGVDPYSYLGFVHDVDMSLVAPELGVREAILNLPGRKLIFTNADAPYASRILKLLGLDDVFETIFDIHCMAHRPKPDPQSYDLFCMANGVDPARALFVEDSAHNLEPAKLIGMTTIWMNHDTVASNDAPSYVDQQIHDLSDWLNTIKVNESAL
jgi:putative hydrolase of the HAD superfamily